MKEEWKDIIGYEGLYQVSNLGRVKSINRVVYYNDGRKFNYSSKILKVNINKRNYNNNIVHLYKNGIRKAIPVHRLVATSFIVNNDNLPEVNHIDGNRNNNKVENLEWSSRKDNMKHAFDNGLINNIGINHGNNIYAESQIIEVKKLLLLKLPHKQIEEITGVKKGTIEQISRNKQWKHITIKIEEGK